MGIAFNVGGGTPGRLKANAPQPVALNAQPGAYLLMAADNSVNRALARTILKNLACAVVLMEHSEQATSPGHNDLLPNSALSLKSPSANLGATALGHLCNKLETLARDSHVAQTSGRVELSNLRPKRCATHSHSKSETRLPEMDNKRDLLLSGSILFPPMVDKLLSRYLRRLPLNPWIRNCRRSADLSSGDFRMASILAVDHSASMRQMLAFTLKGAGYNVIEAVDGKDVLEKAKSGGADVVLTDVNMPNMDGIELVRQLRQLPKYKFTPMLLLTTESGADKKAQGKAAGATGWLVKPFNPEQLLATIAKVLG